MILIHYLLIFTAIYILMGWSLYLPYKIGHLHFLPISIMAISAYFSAFASREWHWPLIIILFSGIITGFLFSYVIGKLMGNASGFSITIMGLTSIFIIRTVIENWNLLGGSMGFFNIPSSRHIIFWVYFFLFLIGYFIYRIDNSILARQSAVLFEDRELASSFGVRSREVALFLHCFSGIIAGLSGTLYAQLVRGLSIDFFGFNMIGSLMTILLVGGRTTMWGIVLSAPLLAGIPILLPDSFSVWRQFIYGGLLIVIIIFLPDGLINKKQILKWQKILKRIEL